MSEVLCMVHDTCPPIRIGWGLDIDLYYLLQGVGGVEVELVVLVDLIIMDQFQVLR